MMFPIENNDTFLLFFFMVSIQAMRPVNIRVSRVSPNTVKRSITARVLQKYLRFMMH